MNYTCDHFKMYTSIKSLHCTSKNMFYINYTSKSTHLRYSKNICKSLLI